MWEKICRKSLIFVMAAAVTLSMTPLASYAETGSADNEQASGSSAAQETEEQALNDLDGSEYDGYIVTFKDDAGNKEIKKTVSGEGDDCEAITSLAAQDEKMAVVSAEDSNTSGSDETPADIVESYEDDSNVVDAVPNYKRKAQSVTSLNEGYALSQMYQFGLMNVTAAWSRLDANTPVSKVKVAVIDTGADLDHEDLAANLDTRLARGYVDGRVVSGQDGDTEDTHGTHVTGIIGATADNGLGIAGTASGGANSYVDIIPVRVLSSDGYMYDSDIISGISYAVSCGAKVINMSMGGDYDDTQLDSSIAAAYKAGVTVVCAAGNEAQEGNPIEYPAASPHTISVAACDSSGNRAYFSNYNQYVDVMAPGVGIYSTVGGSSKYAAYSGTSMACPMVSAEAALLYAYYPGITASQVTSAIRASCSHAASGRDDRTGYGLVDYNEALNDGLTAGAEYADTETAYEDTGTAYADGGTAAAAVKAGVVFTSGSLKYRVTTAASAGSTGKVQVIAPKSRKSKSITVPATVKHGGCKFRVTSIKSSAFKNSRKLKTVTVKSRYLIKIGVKAFKRCHKSCSFRIIKSRYSKYRKLLKKSGVPAGSRYKRI